MPWCTVGSHEFLGIYLRSSSWCGQSLYLLGNLAGPVRINFFRTLEMNLGVVAHTCNPALRRPGQEICYTFRTAWITELILS